ncbi:hypothetical protein Y1Q_0012511 [Alligator mississippiensis]|uniref:Uncharacterized protein n=1 Tax=Alligator mississippiensis TaxID=8496 RepID=A0A151M841_ALLMI|nr:hypothetical protein Y1Q_0012511 [Alligator mississippiensis]
MCFLEEPGRISPSFYNRDMENTALMDIAINIQREQKLFALVPDFQNWNNKALHPCLAMYLSSFMTPVDLNEMFNDKHMQGSVSRILSTGHAVFTTLKETKKFEGGKYC